jgi:ribosome-associated translation inhibitor RaiA
VTPGRGDVSLGFALYGDSLRGRWTVTAPAATWQRDSGAAGGMAADILWRVVTGIENLDLTAELGGTLSHPELHVRSNLDHALSDRLHDMIGAEVDAAESRLRVAVDRFADEKVAPLKAQVDQVTAEANTRVQQARQALDAAQQQLEQQLRRLTGGIRLP